MNGSLRGTLIPAVTVFDEAGGLDVDGILKNFESWGSTDVGGYMVLGSNGEFRMLDDEESRTIIQLATRMKADKTLIVGVGRESAHHTMAFIHSIERWYERIDYLSVLTPSYFAKLMDGPALLAYYETIADASPLPIMLYVAPGFANGVTIPPIVVGELAQHPNIAGIKDTSPSGMVDFMLHAGRRSDFLVLAGSLNNIMTAMSFGGPGGVVSAANFLPAQCAKLTTLYLSGQHSLAYDYYLRLQRLVKATGGKQSIASLKAAMDAMGLRGGAPRRPVLPLDRYSILAMRDVLLSGLSELD